MPKRLIFPVTVLFASSAVSAERVTRFTLPSGVMVQITEANFDRSNFRIQGCRSDASGCLIDGRIPFGTSAGLPKTYVKEIEVTSDGVSYSLDSSSMFDAWGARPLEVAGAIRYFGGKCFDRLNCQFRGLFSDAAGAFAAEWQVIGGVSVRTVLTASSDIRDAVRKNIDPLEYE